jgi:hypothetical protein
VLRFLRKGGQSLPVGVYRAKLTAGGKLIAVARVRIR